MNKTKFSIEKAVKAVEISSRIDGNKTVSIDPVNWKQNSPLNKYRKTVNVDPKVIDIVKKYLAVLADSGVKISNAHIYGSQANGTATEGSDIDLMLVSPLFDEDTDKYIPILWLSTRKISYKIEPVAIGQHRFQTDDVSPLIEVVRQEGIEIAAKQPNYLCR